MIPGVFFLSFFFLIVLFSGLSFSGTLIPFAACARVVALFLPQQKRRWRCTFHTGQQNKDHTACCCSVVRLLGLLRVCFPSIERGGGTHFSSQEMTHHTPKLKTEAGVPCCLKIGNRPFLQLFPPPPFVSVGIICFTSTVTVGYVRFFFFKCSIHLILWCDFAGVQMRGNKLFLHTLSSIKILLS